MKKIFLLIGILIFGMAAYSQQVYKPNALTRFVKTGSTWVMYYDSLGNGTYVAVPSEGWVQAYVASHAGAGNTNSNIGSGYRAAVPNTNNIKTLFGSYAFNLDSTSNTNGITFIIDSSLFSTRAWRQKGIDSVVTIFSGYVPTTRTVNGKALSSNITLGLASSDFANQGTTTTVLHGNTSGNPTFGQIVNADITNGTIDVTAKITGIVPIANGGTGNSSLTAYAIIAGGTTPTGAMQQVSGVGSSGQVLTSNGAAALPTWQTPAALQNFYYYNAISPDSSFVLRNDSTLISKMYLMSANSNRIRQLAHTYSGDSAIYEPFDINVVNLGTGTANSTTVLHGDSAWAPIGLTTDVTGVLPIANGGTNISTYATGDIPYASAANTLSKLASPAANKILVFDNTDGIPAYATIGTNLSYDHSSHTLSATGGSGGSAIINSTIDWVLADSAMGIVNKGQPVGLNLQIATTAGNLTDARANFVAVWINADTTVNGVAFYIVTQGDYNADQNNYAALYSYSSSSGTLTQIAISANDTALWKTATANTFATATFTTPVHVTRGLYFVGYLSNWASVVTTPQLKVGATASNGAIYTAGGSYPNSGKLLGFVSSRNTLPSSQAMSGVTVNTIMPYLRLF